MVDTSSLWEHLLSQRPGFVANMQFKGSTVTGKIQTVALMQKKLLLSWFTKGIFQLQAGAGMESRTHVKKDMVRTVHGSVDETERANQNRIQMQWLPWEIGKLCHEEMSKKADWPYTELRLGIFYLVFSCAQHQHTP